MSELILNEVAFYTYNIEPLWGSSIRIGYFIYNHLVPTELV